MLKERITAIPQEDYSRDYFLSTEEGLRGGAAAYGQFKRGGKPLDIFLRATEYLPKYFTGSYLDVGCGKGELPIYLARLGKKAYGIDYSEAAIKICQDTLKSEKKEVARRVSFSIVDCIKLPFQDDFFQGAFLIDVIEHLTPQQLTETLREIHRVLKPGGLLIIHAPNSYFEQFSKLTIAFFYQGWKILLHPRKTLFEATFNNDSQKRYEYMHINYLSGKGMEKYLKQNGFETDIEYSKPKSKKDIEHYLGHNSRLKKFIFYSLAWILLNSPLITLLAPSCWIIARKTD